MPGTPQTDSEAYRIIFDGGSLGNPGRGYGSYNISGPNGYTAVESLNYDHRGNRVTNNEAEYLTLIAALDRLAKDLGPAATSSKVTIFGDSKLVISQLLGQWKVRKEELKPMHAEAASLLRRFARCTLTWHPRKESVKVLGH